MNGVLEGIRIPDPASGDDTKRIFDTESNPRILMILERHSSDQYKAALAFFEH